MFRLHLKIKKKSENLLCLVLAKGFRYFFLIFASFLTLFFILDIRANPGSSPVVPLIVISIFILSGFYYEEWIFDLTKNTVESRFGLLFLFQRKTIPLGDIESFKIVEFTKGHQGVLDPEKKRFFQITYSKFSLIAKDGLLKDIEIIKSKYKNELEKKAATVAEFCKKALIKE